MSLDLPFPVAPAPGQTLAVAPGVLWLRMPLPFALDHINLWLIEEADGWTLIDTGLNSNKSRALWEGVFAGPMGGRAARRLFCTHFHPDHMSLADWLVERFGLVMETTLGEWTMGRATSLTNDESFISHSMPFYRAAGFDEGQIAVLAERGNSYARLTPRIPQSYVRRRGGDVLTMGGKRWEIIIGEGHSPELAALYCAELRVLISGDQILPTISPNVSVWPNEPDGNPLALYLDSLGRFRHLPDDTLVLPSHGLPFRGLHRRLDEMASHHDQRLARALAACAEPKTGTDVVKVLFRRELDKHQLFFAVGEALAHLHMLRVCGQVTRETDADGVNRWLRV